SGAVDPRAFSSAAKVLRRRDVVLHPDRERGALLGFPGSDRPGRKHAQGGESRPLQRTAEHSMKPAARPILPSSSCTWAFECARAVAAAVSPAATARPYSFSSRASVARRRTISRHVWEKAAGFAGGFKRLNSATDRCSCSTRLGSSFATSRGEADFGFAKSSTTLSLRQTRSACEMKSASPTVAIGVAGSCLTVAGLFPSLCALPPHAPSVRANI